MPHGIVLLALLFLINKFWKRGYTRDLAFAIIAALLLEAADKVF